MDNDSLIVLDNFFPLHQYNQIVKKSHEANLGLSALGDNKYYGQYDTKKIQDIKQEVLLSKQPFKYIFYRSEADDRATLELKHIFNQSWNINIFNDFVPNKITQVNICFVSCYKKGCFLLEHYDGCKGKYAFIYYLNDIDDHQGGILLVNKKIKVEPKANRMVLLKTDVLHEVLEVKYGMRWAFTGWLI